MFGRQFKLFELFGFTVKADSSWFIIIMFLTWTLASAYFPFNYPGLSGGSYLLLGLMGTIGLFTSIVVHEYSHALVAKHYGIPMKGITLWVFGGVAEMSEEPKVAMHELYMAGIGPVTSFAIAGLCYGLERGLGNDSPYVGGVLAYLWRINLVLAIFNLLPAFPLDGGRILRSALWRWKGEIKWATRVASNIGSGFGYALMFLGFLGFVTGDFIGGIWYFVIGLFIRGAAKMSYLKLKITQTLEGEPIHRIMKPVATVPAYITVDDVINRHVLGQHATSFAVVDELGSFLGSLNLASIRRVPLRERASTTALSAAEPASESNSVDVDMDSSTLWTKINALPKESHLIVLDEGRPIGTISQADLIRFVSLKMQLSGDDEDLTQLPAAS